MRVLLAPESLVSLPHTDPAPKGTVRDQRGTSTGQTACRGSAEANPSTLTHPDEAVAVGIAPTLQMWRPRPRVDSR